MPMSVPRSPLHFPSAISLFQTRFLTIGYIHLTNRPGLSPGLPGLSTLNRSRIGLPKNSSSFSCGRNVGRCDNDRHRHISAAEDIEAMNTAVPDIVVLASAAETPLVE